MIFFMASPTYWSDCSEGLKQYGTLIVHLHRLGHKSKPIPGLVTDLWFYFFVTLFQNDRGNMIWFFSMESSSNFLANLVQNNSAMFATTDFTFAFCHTLGALQTFRTAQKYVYSLSFDLPNMHNQNGWFQGLFGYLELILVENGPIQHTWRPLLRVPNDPVHPL